MNTDTPVKLTYTLTINAEQADLIREALETYARISIGQMDVICRIFDEIAYALPSGASHDAILAIRTQTEALHRTLRLHSIAGNGQPHTEEAKAAFDIVQVIRHRLAHDSLEPGEEAPCRVSFYEPMRHGPHPLPGFEKENPCPSR